MTEKSGVASTDVQPTTEKVEPTPSDVTPKSAPSSPTPEDDGNELERVETTNYPSGLKKLIITIALCLSVFCVALDNTIIATAIPRITDQFHSINDVGWYGSSYLLTTCAFQLSFGKLYTFLNLKWVYLLAIGWFELGSLICGAAPNSIALILGRAIAGVGSAGIFTGAILIVTVTVPLAQRPLYTGFIGGMYGIASVAGPLMGGAFTDYVTWRLCFYINLPVGLVTVIFIFFFFHPDESAGGKKEKLTWKRSVTAFDLPGLAVLLPLVVCLLLALSFGGGQYSWSNWRVILLFVLTGVLLIVFIAVEWKMGHNATVPGHLLKQRSVASSCIFAFFIGASFFALLYYVPIWFQAIQGVSATESGIRNLPLVLAVTIFSIVSGGGVQGLGYYTPFLIVSSILSAVGAGMLATFTPHTPKSEWIGYQVIYGAGIGLGLQLTLIAIQTVLPKKDIPSGTAMIIFAQTLGGAIFISVAQNVNTNQLLKGLMRAVPDLNPGLVLKTGATDLRKIVPADRLDAVVQVYNDALTNTFYVGVATAAITIFGAVFVEWKSVKGKKIEMAAA